MSTCSFHHILGFWIKFKKERIYGRQGDGRKSPSAVFVFLGKRLDSRQEMNFGNISSRGNSGTQVGDGMGAIISARSTETKM